MPRQRFEFFCPRCEGWILLSLNTAHRGTFGVQCPQCKHIHNRYFQDGSMVDKVDEMKPDGVLRKNAGYVNKQQVRVAGKPLMTIGREGREKYKDVFTPTIAAYSKTSRLEKLEKEGRIAGNGRINTAELWAAKAVPGDDLDFER